MSPCLALANEHSWQSPSPNVEVTGPASAVVGTPPVLETKPADAQAFFAKARRSRSLSVAGILGGAVRTLGYELNSGRSGYAVYAESALPEDRRSRLVALTGPDAAIRKVALAYKVYFARNSLAQGGDYAMDHTGFIYLLDKDGRYLGFLPPGSSPEQIVEAVRQRLAEP